MAISFIVAASSPSNVVAIPASATNGDCIIVLACNTASTTFSASPTGCTTIARKAAISGSMLLAYTFKSAGSALNISAVGADHIGLSIYRGTVTPVPVGTFTASAAAVADALIDIGALTFSVTDGTSWGVGGYFANRTTSLGQPVGMTERFETLSASRAAAVSDTNIGQTTFTAHTATATAARDWASITVELLESAAAATNRTITAEAVAYTHAGQAVLFGVTQPSGAGAIAEAGQDVGLDLAMPVTVATFSMAGQDVTLTATGSTDTPLVAEAGAYTEAGQAVGLDIVMPADAGAFALAGQDVDLTYFTAVEPVIEEVRQSRGSGKARAGEDFWMIREEHLKRLMEEAEKIVSRETIVETIVDKDNMKAIVEAVGERERAYRAAEVAKTVVELNTQAAIVMKLTIDIATMKAKAQEDEELLMLLLLM